MARLSIKNISVVEASSRATLKYNQPRYNPVDQKRKMVLHHSDGEISEQYDKSAPYHDTVPGTI